MPNMLSQLDLNEVSLVDDGANPGARVLFWKRKAKADKPQTTVKSILQKFGFYGEDPEAAATFDELVDAKESQELIGVLAGSLSSIVADTTLDTAGKLAMIQQSVTEFMAELAAEQNAGQDDPSMTKGKTATQEDTMPFDISKATAEEKAELLKQLQADAKPSAEELAKKAEAEKATIEKQVSEAIAKAMEPLQKQVKEQAETITKLTGEKSDSELLAKAKELAAGVPGTKDEDIFTMLKGMDEAGREKFTTMMKAQAEQLKVSDLFKTRGAGGFLEPTGTAAIIKAKAAEVLKVKPTLTPEQAEAEVFKANPALYDKYCAEAN